MHTYGRATQEHRRWRGVCLAILVTMGCAHWHQRCGITNTGGSQEGCSQLYYSCAW